MILMIGIPFCDLAIETPIILPATACQLRFGSTKEPTGGSRLTKDPLFPPRRYPITHNYVNLTYDGLIAGTCRGLPPGSFHSKANLYSLSRCNQNDASIAS